MASSNQTPDVLFSPIAVNADNSDINTIPQTYDPANYGYAAQNVGFPTECRLPVKNPDGTLGQGRAPRMQDWNGIMKLISSHNFFQQNGGSYTFNPTVSANLGGYPKNAVLWYFPENEDPCLVYSLINDNTFNFVDDPTLIDEEHWKKVSLGGAGGAGGGGEIGDMGFAPLGIDESLNLRRYLNGQVISQAQFVSFTTKVKSAVALFPSLATTESNWQAEMTNSKLGQCGKFVIDDDAGTIRLPKVVNINGLQDLALMGGIKAESLPNITGNPAGYLTSAIGTPTGAFTGNTSSGNGNVNPGATSITANFDASRSSSTYQDGANVQQEAVQYPYYIQVATGVEETLPAIREYEINTPFFFGQSMYSDVNPDNASWLVSNGQWNARSVYPDYYDWLNGKIGQVITANGGKVVLSTDAYTDYDFVINMNDQTFRLPLLDGSEDIAGASQELLTISGAAAENAVSIGAQPFNCFVAFENRQQQVASGCQILTNATSGCEQSNTISTNGILSVQTVFAKKGDIIHAYWNGALDPDHSLRRTKCIGNGSLYYYVGDTVQDASLINAGAVLGQLADLNAASRGYVVESYHNGTEWYRIYSDGWIEQGGIVANTGANRVATISLLKPYTDTNYIVTTGQENSAGARGVTDIGQMGAKTTSSFQSYQYNDVIINWKAEGQGD